jgi:hypothetical protein
LIAQAKIDLITDSGNGEFRDNHYPNEQFNFETIMKSQELCNLKQIIDTLCAQAPICSTLVFISSWPA